LGAVEREVGEERPRVGDRQRAQGVEGQFAVLVRITRGKRRERGNRLSPSPFGRGAG
jgi:hypothetical protein